MTATRAWLGVDLGGTKTLVVAYADDLKTRLHEARCPTPGGDSDEVIAATIEQCRTVVAALPGGTSAAGVGVGFAGLVDHRRGHVHSSVILPCFADVALGMAFARGLDLPCTVDNDATAAGYGELVARDHPPHLDMLLLTVGTGIGGAIVVDSQLHRGKTDTAAEFGNTTIDWQGQTCRSGNRGSLNTWASGTALGVRAAARAAQAPGSALHGEAAPIPVPRIAAAAAAGDRPAQEVLDEGARALGAGLANFVNILNPDVVALAGGVCGLGDGYLATVRAELEARAFAPAAAHVTVEFARGGAGSARSAPPHWHVGSTVHELSRPE